MSFGSSKLKFLMRGLIFGILENSNKLLQKTPHLGIILSLFRLKFLFVPDILWTLQYSEEFFYFFSSTWSHFVQISFYFLQSISVTKTSRFRVLNKAVLRGSFDQSNDIVLVAPQKCPLAEVLPIRQNEIV